LSNIGREVTEVGDTAKGAMHISSENSKSLGYYRLLTEEQNLRINELEADATEAGKNFDELKTLGILVGE
jgi:hypothetical protein